MIYKELFPSNLRAIEIDNPVSDDELKSRLLEYDKLTPKKFNTNRTKNAFTPITFKYKGLLNEIQFNACINPLCKNYGLPQERFEIKSKPYRYKIAGSSGDNHIMTCNPERVDLTSPPINNCKTTAISNWSVAEEIERLIRINSLLPVVKEYDFHKPACLNEQGTPKSNPDSFYKRGKNSANSQRYQCKSCKKITSVLPNKKENLKFNQKRNEVLPTFAKLLVNKVPINRACEILEIAKGMYYQKLEWLYRCCLEFLETHETKKLAKTEFPEMWITTDKLHYVLNNVLKKGRGKNRGTAIEDKQLPTYIVASADKDSRYVFRSDLCFDWDISLEDVISNTLTYKDDHLAGYLRRHERFGRYGASPIEPTPNDTQTRAEYLRDLEQFDLRSNFVDGLHVGQTYTSMAHFWLIKQMVNAKRWRFVSDDDDSLKKSIFSVFKEEIKNKNGHYFLCLTDKNLTRKQAKDLYFQSISELKHWAKANGYNYRNLEELAVWYLEEELKHHQFQERNVAPNSEIYYKQLRNRIDHPIPSKVRGNRKLDVLTDLNHLTEYQLAFALIKVNDNAINAFFQTVRRRLSILERPLVTARGDGKSYIYANFNPNYSQMAITILRTYYNFCLTFKTNGRDETPAQRLGLVNKVYSWDDIIYKR